MIEQEFIEKFIDINQPITVRPNRFSTIGILLRAARKLSGRDLSTGLYVMNEINIDNFKDQIYHSNLFSGLINYLIFLEQVGSIFKLKSAKKNGIHIALENFSNLNKKQILAVRALRNSLTHNYGLATENNPKNLENRHKFTLSSERNDEIVKLPSTPWTGDFSNKSDCSNTIIFITNLEDLIENVYLKLKKEVSKNNVEISLSNGLDELKARFTIIA